MYTTKAASEVLSHSDLCTDFIILTNQKWKAFYYFGSITY